jgi:hypothetical protein
VAALSGATRIVPGHATRRVFAWGSAETALSREKKMNRSTLGGVGFVCAAIVVASGVGCSNAHGRGGDESSGTVSLPLSTSAGGVNYRLTNVQLEIEDGTFQVLDESNAGEAALTTTLPTGSYDAFLEENWSLEKDDGTGNFAPVSATLEDSADQPFTVFNGTTTTLTYRFLTDGVIVTVGSGVVSIVAAVDQVPPLCTPFGTDCPSGSWCPPGQLVGSDVSCIDAGSIPPGQPCAEPTDCVANASCFDFGGGPLCTALCPASEFNGPCDSGGTCVPAGVDYGVCQGAVTTDAGASDAGGEGGVDAALPPPCVGEPTSQSLITGAPFPSVAGGVYSFAAPGLTAVSVTPQNDQNGLESLHILASVDPAHPFAGGGISFGFFFSSCVDASAFTGIQFTITGEIGNCLIEASAVPSEDNAVQNGSAGTCVASSCVSPVSAPVSTGTTTVSFASMSGGTPLATVDAHALNDVQWVVVAPTDDSGNTQSCAANFIVSAVSFVN